MTAIRLIVLFCLVVMLPARAAWAQGWEQFERAMGAGQYESAANMAISLAQSTEQPVWMYNAACALALHGKLDDGIDWLCKAADAGYAGVRSIETDSDLDPMREHERFAEAEQQVRANAQARFDGFKRVAERTDPDVKLPEDFRADEPHTLLIVLHGSGGTGRSMAGAFNRVAARHNAILMTPDALRPDGQGFSWVYRDEAEWYVLHCLEWAKAQWNIDYVILAGYSQGANICFDLGQSHAELFDAVLPINGHYEADLAPAPTEGKRPKWYLLIGENDRPAPTYAEAEQTFTEAGMEAQRVLLPGRGHEFPTQEELMAAVGWCVGSWSDE